MQIGLSWFWDSFPHHSVQKPITGFSTKWEMVTFDSHAQYRNIFKCNVSLVKR